MKILFATSFKNEQGSLQPRNVTSVNLGATINTTNVTANGYNLSMYNPAGTTPEWYMEPPVEATERYVSYSVKVTAIRGGQDAVGTAWQWARLNIFGYEILRGEVWPGHFTKEAEVFQFTIIQDTVEGTSKAYINRRYVGSGTVSSRLSWKPSDPEVARTWGAWITDLVVTESDTEEGVLATLEPVAFSEDQVGWTYTGSSLAETVNKNNILTVTPYATSYNDDKTFTLEPVVTDMPLLVEVAGSSTGYYDLTATSGVQTEKTVLTATQGSGGMILEPTTAITFGREERTVAGDIVAWPNFMYQTPSVLSDPLLEGLDAYGYPWSRTSTQGLLSGTLLRADGTSALYCDRGNTANRGLVKPLPRDLFETDWFLQMWFAGSAPVDNQSGQLLQLGPVSAGLSKTFGVSNIRLTGTGFSSNAIPYAWVYLAGNYLAAEKKFWWYLNGAKLATVVLATPDPADSLALFLGSTAASGGINEGISEFKLERGFSYSEATTTIPIPTDPIVP